MWTFLDPEITEFNFSGKLNSIFILTAHSSFQNGPVQLPISFCSSVVNKIALWVQFGNILNSLIAVNMRSINRLSSRHGRGYNIITCVQLSANKHCTHTKSLTFYLNMPQLKKATGHFNWGGFYEISRNLAEDITQYLRAKFEKNNKLLWKYLLHSFQYAFLSGK